MRRRPLSSIPNLRGRRRRGRHRLGSVPPRCVCLRHQGASALLELVKMSTEGDDERHGRRRAADARGSRRPRPARLRGHRGALLLTALAMRLVVHVAVVEAVGGAAQRHRLSLPPLYRRGRGPQRDGSRAHRPRTCLIELRPRRRGRGRLPAERRAVPSRRGSCSPASASFATRFGKLLASGGTSGFWSCVSVLNR